MKRRVVEPLPADRPECRRVGWERPVQWQRVAGPVLERAALDGQLALLKAAGTQTRVTRVRLGWELWQPAG